MIGYGTLGLALATKSNGNEMEVCRFLLGRDGFSLTSQSSMRLNCEARLVLVAGWGFDGCVRSRPSFLRRNQYNFYGDAKSLFLRVSVGKTERVVARSQLPHLKRLTVAST